MSEYGSADPIAAVGDAIDQEWSRRVYATAGQQGCEAARRQLLRAFDETVTTAMKRHGETTACRSGCDYCCHLRVIATAPEVFGLVEYLRKTLDSDAWMQFVDRVEATAAIVRGFSKDQHITTNVACPVLVDGRCGAYAARPIRCRSYHSLDVDVCAHCYAHPTDVSARQPQSALLATIGLAFQTAFEGATEAVGFDGKLYELTTALHEAITDPQANERHARKETAFWNATVDSSLSDLIERSRI